MVRGPSVHRLLVSVSGDIEKVSVIYCYRPIQKVGDYRYRLIGKKSYRSYTVIDILIYILSAL